MHPSANNPKDVPSAIERAGALALGRLPTMAPYTATRAMKIAMLLNKAMNSGAPEIMDALHDILDPAVEDRAPVWAPTVGLWRATGDDGVSVPSRSVLQQSRGGAYRPTHMRLNG